MSGTVPGESGTVPGETTDPWQRALDELEARLQREEAALAAGHAEPDFSAVELPDTALQGSDRVRAQLAMARMRALTESYRTILRSIPSNAVRSHSPYR